jgi:hypothetical protein
MQLQLQFIIYFLPVSSGFHFHTREFRSLFPVFSMHYALHITPVTSHQHAPQHGYNAVAKQCGAGSRSQQNQSKMWQIAKADILNHMEGQRLDRLDIAMQLHMQFIIYFLPVLSGFHFYTHVFRSFFRVFYALRPVHITPVTSRTRAATRI